MQKRRSIPSFLMLVLFGVSIAALTVTLISSQSTVAYLRDEVEEGIYSRTAEVSKRGAALVTAETLHSFQHLDDMYRADYQLLRNNMADLAEDADVLFVYYLREEEDNKFQYIISNDYTAAMKANLTTPREDISAMPGLAALLGGEVESISFVADGVFSVCTPIFDEGGDIVAVCRVDASDEVYTRVVRQANTLSFISLGATLLIMASASLSLVGYRRESKTAQMLREIAERERNIYYEESLIDELTQLENRRAFEQKFERFKSSNRPTDIYLCLGMIDIDYFKQYNDYYGHPRGDECLRQIGRILNGLRESMNVYAARVGGEEFALLWFHNHKNKDVSPVVLTLQKEMNALAIPHERSDVSQIVTVSIGVQIARCQEKQELDALYETADQYLYQAKHSGRNCAVVCGEIHRNAVVASE